MESILIIDRDEHIEGLVRYYVSELSSDTIVSIYDPSEGLPKDLSVFAKYRALLLNYELNPAEESGLDWLEKLVQCPGIPPILLMSDHTQDALAKKAIASGATNYFAKDNISAKQLCQMIREIIGDHHPEETEQVAAADSQDPNSDTMMFTPYEDDLNAESNMAELRSTTDTRELIQHELPGYKILGKLGQGGMASIYLAEREEDQLWVALKVLDIVNMEKQEILRRFMREYRALAELDHQNIAHIYERAFSTNYAYIAMEYCPSGDLAQALENKLLPEVAVDYLVQISQGLGAAHKINIIHRDMKPENVLCREEGTLAITDFGIAVNMGRTRSLQQAKELIGTAHYISPEQINGQGANKHSDLYSLGVMFYRMLTGTLPFRGKSVDDILRAHLMQSIPRLPEELANFQPVIDGLLVKDTDERFQDTDELIAALEWA